MLRQKVKELTGEMRQCADRSHDTNRKAQEFLRRVQGNRVDLGRRRAQAMRISAESVEIQHADFPLGARPSASLDICADAASGIL